MAEWFTCYDGCECADCRQRRSDYFFIQSIKNDSEYQEEIIDNRFDTAMNNLGYNKKFIKDYRK